MPYMRDDREQMQPLVPMETREFKPPTVDMPVNNELMIINDVLGRELGQLRPANTTAVSIFSPKAETVVAITSIMVCNTSVSASSYRICKDEGGTTYDETTALFWDIAIPSKTTDQIEFDKPIFMRNSAGNLSVRTGNNDALTFTVHGMEYAKR
jgi:hypothetical protein